MPVIAEVQNVDLYVIDSGNSVFWDLRLGASIGCKHVEHLQMGGENALCKGVVELRVIACLLGWRSSAS